MFGKHKITQLMKIAFLSTMYPFRGGIAQFNAEMYRYFEKEHEVKAFTFTRQYPEFLFPGETQLVTEDDNADVIPSLQVLDSINPISYLKTAKAINAFAPDLLIMKYWIPFLAPSLGTAAKFVNSKTKIITSLDNVIPHEKRFIDNTLTKYFLGQNDGFVAMSESVQNDLLQLKPDSEVALHDHPLYSHFGEAYNREKAMKELNLDPTKKTLLFFGFIREYKGLDVLIEAFNGLDESYQLVVAGETYGSFDMYQKRIDQNKNKDRIHLYNQYISDAEVAKYFAVADVCVLPYRSATQSGITSIALHFDTPVIATDVGGLKEVVKDGETGLIIAQPESVLVQQGIERFFDEFTPEQIQRGIDKMKERLSWKSYCDTLLKVYDRIK